MVPAPTAQPSEVEAGQRMTAMFAKNRYRRHESVSTLLNYLRWPPLAERREIALFIKMFKIINILAAVRYHFLTSDDGCTKENHAKNFGTFEQIQDHINIRFS